MKFAQGWWYPSHERHFIQWCEVPKNKIVVEGRYLYQARKQEAFLGFCKRRRVAVDIGAHIGTWAWNLAKHFERVEAFEPVALHRECFARNVTASNVSLHPVALGAAPGRVSMWTEDGSSGNTQVRGDGDIEMRTLDSYEFPVVDSLKIDAEGYELYILQGAVETLKRCRPVVIVEQKPRVIGNFGFKGPEAVRFLEELGAKVRREYSGDYFLTFED